MKPKTLLCEFSQYVALNICGMLGLSCYILADTFFVSKGVGAEGLAALNLAIPIYSFVHGIGLMLGMGGATKYSIFMGQGQCRQANRCFWAMLSLAAGFAAAFMAAGLFLAEPIARLLKADGEVFGMTKTYLQVILLFSPAFIMNEILICFVRNDGSPKLSMAAMLAGSLANILFDYLLIFPMGMGILGAVLATGFAPVIGMGILSRHWTSGKSHIRMGKLSFSPELAAAALGLPYLITEVASGLVMIVFNLLILRLKGNIGVAAYGVVANLSLVVASVYAGIAQGSQPIISRAYGQGDGSGGKKALAYGAVTALALSGMIYLVFFIWAEGIVGIFNSGHSMDLQQIAEGGLKLYFTAMPFAGANVVLSAYFAAVEQALPAQAISLSRGFLIIIPMALLLSFALGMDGIWLSCPVTEFLVSVMGLKYLTKGQFFSSFFTGRNKKTR